MITYTDQNDLFTLISKKLQRDLVIYAFGGNAMMYYGYKDETKDVDLLFEMSEERNEFIRILKQLGYFETSPITIYIPEKLRDPHCPLMFKRDEGRFDLFVRKIFRTILSPRMKEDLFAVREYKDTQTLIVKVLRKEHLVLLKAVTDRENDFRDIQLIVSQDKQFDWQYFIDEVIWQFQHGDGWVLLDVEKMMKELKKYVFIEEKY
ncbi:MAG: hypothetical protein AABX37_01900, partial [Nanoarchaeota archaeon]